MSINAYFFVFLSLLILSIAYAFWRSYRVVLFRSDLLDERASMRMWAEAHDLSQSHHFVSLDRLLYFTAEAADRVSAFDFLIFFVMGEARRNPTASRLHPLAFACIDDDAPEEVQLAAKRMLWRTFRYVVFESVSGFLSTALLIAWLVWHKIPGWAMSIKGIMASAASIVMISGINRRGPTLMAR